MENGKLVTELEPAKQNHRGCSNNDETPADAVKGNVNEQSERSTEPKTVTIEEYKELEDYIARIDSTRRFLDSKVRYYKDLTKDWRNYYNRWILKHPGQEPRKLGPKVPNISGAAGTRDPRFSSAPAPPDIPDGVNASMSDSSPVSSPRTGSERPQSRCKSDTPKVQQAVLDRSATKQKILHTPDRANSGDLTEASDESEGLLDPSSIFDRQSRKHIELNARAQAEDSGSSPIIVSERSLKRKNPPKASKENASLKTPPVKDEDSSPLVRPSVLQLNGLHDSLDLDDVGGHVDTPRKRRKLEAMRRQSSLISPAAVPDDEGMLDKPTMQHPRNDLSVKDFHDNGILTSPSSNPLAKHEDLDSEEQERKSRKALSKARQQAHNKRISERLDITEAILNCSHVREINSSGPGSMIGVGRPDSPAPFGSFTPSSRSDVQPGTPQDRRTIENRNTALAKPFVLQPTDPNSHILPRTNEKPPNQKSYSRRRGRNHGAAHVPALAEDGEDTSMVGQKPRTKRTAPGSATYEGSRAPDTYHRLGTLLEPSPFKSSLKSVNPEHGPQITGSSNLPPVQVNRHPTVPMTPSNMPSRKDTPKAKQSDYTAVKQPSNIQTGSNKAPESARVANKNHTRQPSSRKLRSTGSSTAAQPKQTPLRNRPLDQLRYEDFKLNPAHNDYASYESIRKHDEKKALSGCTNRNCTRCKNMRKFVENSGYATTTPGQDSEETDRRLLENYLGKDHTSKLKNMPAEERKELLVQARAQQFANEFGKHRTPFRRAQSPVGFWNVGMPSTQEHLRNLEKVGEREREEVKEMYWEALRERGRYVFADE